MPAAPLHRTCAALAPGLGGNRREGAGALAPFTCKRLYGGRPTAPRGVTGPAGRWTPLGPPTLSVTRDTCGSRGRQRSRQQDESGEQPRSGGPLFPRPAARRMGCRDPQPPAHCRAGAGPAVLSRSARAAAPDVDVTRHSQRRSLLDPDVPGHPSAFICRVWPQLVREESGGSCCTGGTNSTSL